MALATAATSLPALPTLPYSETFTAFWDEATRRVTVTSRLTLEDFRRFMSDEDWNTAVALAERLRGRRVLFVNSTMKGGGVVIMRKPLIVLLKLLGVNCDWYVLAPNPEAFVTTKYCFHCNFQNTSGIQALTEVRKAAYLGWIANEFDVLAPALAEADVFVCDDWQPGGLIPYIRRAGYKCVILFRDHIQSHGDLMVTPGTTQAEAWDFLWSQNLVNTASVFIAHPVSPFFPGNVPARMRAMMPATIEPNDELLRPVTAEETETESDWMDEQFVAHGCKPLNRKRPYIVLVARYDEAKYQDGALRYYASIVAKLKARGYTMDQIPSLVLVGYAATDDPSGQLIVEKILNLRSSRYRRIQDSIHVARLEPRDLAINVLVRGAWLGWQPSIAEGFESRVLDMIWLGIPVLGSIMGGIPLQIVEGKSGFKLNPYNHRAWADKTVELFIDKDLYDELRRTTSVEGRAHAMRFLTGKNAISWMTLSLLAMDRPDFDYRQRWADTLTKDALGVAA